MIKIICLVIIVVCCFYIGTKIKDIYVKRCKILQQMLEFLDFVEGDINYYRSNIEVLLKKYVSSYTNELSGIIENLDIASKNYNFDNRLSKEICQMLTNIFESIVNLDTASQKLNFDRLRTDVKNLAKKNHEDMKNKGGLWQKILPLIGAGISLLLL